MNLRQATTLLALAILPACGSDGIVEQPTYSVDLIPASVSLTLGGASASAPLNATVTRKLGANSVVDNTSTVTWTSSDANVATVTGSGRSATVTGMGQGTATITAASNGATGSSVITVTAPVCTTGSALALTAGTVVTGTLSTADCRLDNAAADLYRLTMTSTLAVTFDLTSTGFLPALALFDGNGVGITAHKPSSGGAAQITTVLTPGTYYVSVGAQSATASGTYTLKATTGSPVCALGNSISTITPSTTPTTINGTLAFTDCKLTSGENSDLYRLTVGASTNVQIDLASLAFDAFLVLVDANATTIVQDDDSGGGNNSRITRVLAAGTYYILATSFDVGETGAYTLTVKIP